MSAKTITVVSGIQRSGTAMVMQMLEKAGLEAVVDIENRANQGNPRGYYNCSLVKGLGKDNSFLENAVDKSLKVFAAFIPRLPDDYQYKVIFIDRDLTESWISLQKRINAMGKNMQLGFLANRRKEKIKIKIETAKEWIAKQDNVEVIYVDYNEILKNPLAEATRISDFLDQDFDPKLMAEAVEPSLKNENAKVLITTDRAPVAIAKLIDKYAAGKIYCEIGIGEGHNLNALTTPKKLFGVELAEYGVRRSKQLYPHIEVMHDDILNVLPSVDFEVCYLWLTYPICKKVVTAILEKDDNIVILMGLTYYYHLDKDDEKRLMYEKAYTGQANAKNWNENVKAHLGELDEKGFKHEIVQIEEENGELFSVAIIQKK